MSGTNRPCPRKHSDKIWKEFKDACNHYFNKLKEQKDEHS
jgi:hypothetical protein